MGNSDLKICADHCVSWCDSAIKELNDSQKVEFYRLVEFVNATKLQYKKLVNGNRKEIKRLSEINFSINIAISSKLLK